MSNEYQDKKPGKPSVFKPSGGGNPNAPSGNDGQKFADAIKNTPFVQAAQAVAEAPLAARNVANKVGKSVGKFGKKLGL